MINTKDFCQHECVQMRPSMKERVRALREEAILDAASDIIVAKGYAAMTLDDITEAVGISKPTLYLHFRSKEDIVERIAVRCLQMAVDFLASQDQERPATERIQEFIVWCVGTRFGESSLLFQDVGQHILPNHAKDSIHFQVEVQITSTVTRLFKQAQVEGGIRDDVPAVMLSGILMGFVKNWRLDEQLAESKLDLKQVSASWMKLLQKR